MIKSLNKSLLLQLVTSFSLLSMVIVGVVALRAYNLSKEALKKSVFDRLGVAASIKDDQIDRWLNIQRQDVLLSAQLPEVRDRAKVLLTEKNSGKQSLDYLQAYKEFSEYLSDLAAIKPNLQEISLLTNGGIVLVSTNKTLEGKYQPLGFTTTYFTREQENVEPNFDRNSITGKPEIVFATPILDSSNNRIGVISIALDLKEVDGLIRYRTGLGETAETYIVGRLESKNAFISSSKYHIQKYPDGISSVGIDAATVGENGAGLYHNYDGVPVIGVYRWLDKQNLALLAEISQEEAFSPARELARKLFLVGLSASGVLLMGVYLLSRRITKPIMAIADAAIELADGNLTHKAPVLAENEIGVLARVFNKMAEQLQESFAALENNNNELKFRVEEGTAELWKMALELGETVEERTAQLKKAMEEANAANKAKSEFLANMSHELRTPLNAIIGYSDMLSEVAEDNSQKEYIPDLQKIQSAGKHLLSLISDILDLSKIEAGQMELYPEKIEIAILIEDVVATINPLIKNNANTLILNCPSEIGTMHSDLTKIRQNLLNLLSNASKFTKQGEITPNRKALHQQRSRLD